ncbi:unnamed protein product [Onchocerca ochengi]|uniref:Uncharacterized protein n=2 Tax=Onchocerca TaxID=6281 RepID=A0A2K6VFS9_ONCVO|nr:unnamed protein product [Onchocerca ochengi]
MSVLFLLLVICIVGAVGYFVVKKRNVASAAAAAEVRDDAVATAKPTDASPGINIATPSTGTDTQGMEGSKSGSKKKKKKGSKKKKQ